MPPYLQYLMHLAELGKHGIEVTGGGAESSSARQLHDKYGQPSGASEVTHMQPDFMSNAGTMMASNEKTGEQSHIATPKNQDEFDALPPGTFYIEPDDGHIYQKGNKIPYDAPPVNPHPPRGTLV